MLYFTVRQSYSYGGLHPSLVVDMRLKEVSICTVSCCQREVLCELTLLVTWPLLSSGYMWLSFQGPVSDMIYRAFQELSLAHCIEVVRRFHELLKVNGLMLVLE